MQNGDNLRESFFLEQAIPDVAAEGLCAGVAQPEVTGRRLMPVKFDPLQRGFSGIEAAICLVRNMLVVVRLDVAQVSLSIG